jgi:excisionase family DNA binding protein
MIKTDLVGSVEAAAILGVPRVTFNRWAASGKIPAAIKASGRTGVRLFNRSDIEDFARASTNTGAPGKLQQPA